MGIEYPGICGAEDPPQKRKKVSPLATEAKLRQLAKSGCPVYYFYSSERYLVRQAVAAAVRMLSADSDEDATILDGAAPELEQLIMAAGTISFFGTRRVVVLPEIDPAAYGSKDLERIPTGTRKNQAGQAGAKAASPVQGHWLHGGAGKAPPL
mgnify:CR=1 FL=1